MKLSLTWVTFSMKYAIARMSEHLMILYIAAMKNERLVRILNLSIFFTEDSLGALYSIYVLYVIIIIR